MSNRSTKPDTRQAMRGLIRDIRSAIPFGLAADDVCADECRSCSLKLLEYLESELDSWQYRLDNDEIPNFGDLSRLARSGRKIFAALHKNGLIETECATKRSAR